MATTTSLTRLTALALAAGCVAALPSTAQAAPAPASPAAMVQQDDDDDNIVTTLPIEPQVQERNKWCWIATGLTVIRYLGNSEAKRLTQNELCNIANGLRPGSTCPNKPGPITPLQRAARRFGINPGRHILRPVSFNTIKNQINRNQPLWIALKWKQIDGGHLLTISGYNNDEREYQVLDPWPRATRVSWYDHEWSQDNEVYRWIESVYGLRSYYNAAHHSPAPMSDATTPTPPLPARRVDTTDTPDVDVWNQLHTRIAALDTMRASSDATAQVLALTPATLPQRITRMMAEAHTRLTTQRDASITGLTGTRTTSAAPAELTDQIVSTYQLNPEFLAGRSTNPATHTGYAQLARTTNGDTAVAHYGQSRGQLRFAGYSTGDVEVRYALQAAGGTVFMEPTTRAWFRVTGTTVTPLDDAARAITATPLTLEQYRASAQQRLS